MTVGAQPGSQIRSSGPHARRAQPSDLAELVRLDSVAREQIASLRGGTLFLAREARPAPAAASLEHDLSAPDRRVLIGCISTATVGYAAARLERLQDGSLLAQVTELFVEPEARDVGVGRALMHDMLRWAEEQDCAGVGSSVLPGDRSSKNFFESFGLVARAITVYRDLQDR
jgi:GNAT superfamily N-acetyltransferase